MSVTRNRSIAVPATFAIVVALAGAAGMIGRGLTSDPPSTRGVPDVGNGWARPTAVDAVSLSSAQKSVGYDLPTPNDALASAASLSAAFVDADGNTVRLDYESGVIVVVSPWPKGKDASRSYQQQWTESGGLGSLETIDGNPAWIVPGDAKPTHELPDGTTSFVYDTSMNTVELTLGSLDVVIVGKQSVDDLIRVATTVK